MGRGQEYVPQASTTIFQISVVAIIIIIITNLQIHAIVIIIITIACTMYIRVGWDRVGDYRDYRDPKK